MARPRARRDRRADGRHHRCCRHLPQGAPRLAAPCLGRRLQRRQRAQPPPPLLAPPAFLLLRHPRRRISLRRSRDARLQRPSKEQVVSDEQGEGVPGAVLRDVVRDGERVGVRREARVVPPGAEAVRALHRTPRMERRRLLTPVPPLPPALLPRPGRRLRARLQHELGVRRPGRLRRAACRAAAVAVQGARRAERPRPRRSGVLHMPGAVQGEGGGEAAAVHAHVPPEMRGQVAQDHLLLPSMQARAQLEN